jgi:tol-pal system protein YbgF
MRIPPTALACLLVSALHPRPALAGMFDDEQARARIEQVRRENAERYAKLEAAQETTARGQLELANQLEQLRQEIARLRGDIELITHEIDQSKKRQKDFYVDLDNRLRKLESGAREAKPETPPAYGADPAIEAKDYENALNLFKSAKYAEATAAFDAFAKNHPSSPFAAGAVYWSAQSHYQLRDCRKAMDAFQKIVQLWPKDPKVPDAMVGTATCQQELGDAKGARATLESVVAKYPTSPAATTARDRLKTAKR